MALIITLDQNCLLVPEPEEAGGVLRLPAGEAEDRDGEGAGEDQVKEAAAEGGQAEVRRQALDRQGRGRHDGEGLEDLQGGLQYRHQGRQYPASYAELEGKHDFRRHSGTHCQGGICFSLIQPLSFPLLFILFLLDSSPFF